MPPWCCGSWASFRAGPERRRPVSRRAGNPRSPPARHPPVRDAAGVRSSNSIRAWAPMPRLIASGNAAEPYSSSLPWITSVGQLMRPSSGCSDQSANAGASQVSVHASSTQRAFSPCQRDSRAMPSGVDSDVRAVWMPSRVRSSTNACAARLTTARQPCGKRAALASAIAPPTLWPSRTWSSMQSASRNSRSASLSRSMKSNGSGEAEADDLPKPRRS